MYACSVVALFRQLLQLWLFHLLPVIDPLAVETLVLVCDFVNPPSAGTPAPPAWAANPRRTSTATPWRAWTSSWRRVCASSTSGSTSSLSGGSERLGRSIGCFHFSILSRGVSLQNQPPKTRAPLFFPHGQGEAGM